MAKSHSLLQRGQTDLVLSHLWMQSRWKTWPQFPNAMERPLSLVGLGLAWYSMEGSFREFRQMAHWGNGGENRGVSICIGGRAGQGRAGDRLVASGRHGGGARG